jgi:hypothetical protein
VLEALISHEDEEIRLGAIGILDGLAEATQEIGPILPGLRALFDQSDTAFEKTREAAARCRAGFWPRRESFQRDFSSPALTSSRFRKGRKSAKG